LLSSFIRASVGDLGHVNRLSHVDARSLGEQAFSPVPLRLSLLKTRLSQRFCVVRSNRLFGRSWSDGLGSFFGHSAPRFARAASRVESASATAAADGDGPDLLDRVVETLEELAEFLAGGAARDAPLYEPSIDRLWDSLGMANVSAHRRGGSLTYCIPNRLGVPMPPPAQSSRSLRSRLPAPMITLWLVSLEEFFGPGGRQATGRQMAGEASEALTRAPPDLLGDTSVPGDRTHPWKGVSVPPLRPGMVSGDTALTPISHQGPELWPSIPQPSHFPFPSRGSTVSGQH